MTLSGLTEPAQAQKKKKGGTDSTADFYSGASSPEEREFRNRFPMPKFTGDDSFVEPTDPNAPSGATGKSLQQFTPTGPPPKLYPDPPQQRVKKPKTATDTTYTSYYTTPGSRPIPSFETETWQEGDKAYISGAPYSGSGRQLQPYGSTASDWVEGKNHSVDMSGLAEADRNGDDQVEVRVKEPGGPRPRSLVAVAARVGDAIGRPEEGEIEMIEGEEAAMEETVAEAPVEEAPLDDTPIVEELRGIELISAWEKNRSKELGEETTDRSQLVSSAPESESLLIDPDLEVPDDVRLMFADQIGQPLSLASLDSMLRSAIVGYQGSDIPVVDIAIPEQEITDGILRLDVLEARMGAAGVEDAENPGEMPRFTDTDHLMAQVQTQEGEKLRSSELLDDVAWLNRYPFRRVDLVYTPGEDFGETDVILRTISRKPWLFYTGIDNTGNDLLGELRWNSSLTIGSPFGLDDHLVAYQFSTDTEFDHITSHSFVYTLPIYWDRLRSDRQMRHQLTILGAYADVRADVQVGDVALSLDGFSAQSSLRYLIPVKRSTEATHELEFGYDWKASNNNLEFNTIEVFDTTTHIHQFTAGWNSRYEQFLGLLGFANLDFDVVFSPGDLSDRNTDETFALARAGAPSDYAYVRGAAEWHVPLNTWELVTRVSGQWSGQNLLATETLGAGGWEDVRGFEERVARGDRGVKGSFELKTPQMVVPSWLDNGRRTESWQGLAFFDWAHLEDVEPLPGAENDRSLSSTGVGLRYEFDKHFDLGVDYGWVVNASGFEDDEDGRWHFRGRLSF